jgi:hypothetical protein
MEDILAIAQKKLRTSTDNYRRTAGKSGFDRYFRNSGYAARIEQVQSVGGQQASLKPTPKEVLENSVYEGIDSPFSLLDRLWRTFGQSRDFLCQPFISQTPSQAAGDQTGNFGCSAAELAFNCDGLNHCFYPQPAAISPPAPGSFFFKKTQERA